MDLDLAESDLARGRKNAPNPSKGKILPLKPSGRSASHRPQLRDRNFMMKDFPQGEKQVLPSPHLLRNEPCRSTTAVIPFGLDSALTSESTNLLSKQKEELPAAIRKQVERRKDFKAGERMIRTSPENEQGLATATSVASKIKPFTYREGLHHSYLIDHHFLHFALFGYWNLVKKETIYVQSLVMVGPTKMYVVQPDRSLFLPDLFDSLAAWIGIDHIIKEDLGPWSPKKVCRFKIRSEAQALRLDLLGDDEAYPEDKDSQPVLLSFSPMHSPDKSPLAPAKNAFSQPQRRKALKFILQLPHQPIQKRRAKEENPLALSFRPGRSGGSWRGPWLTQFRRGSLGKEFKVKWFRVSEQPDPQGIGRRLRRLFLEDFNKLRRIRRRAWLIHLLGQHLNSLAKPLKPFLSWMAEFLLIRKDSFTSRPREKKVGQAASPKEKISSDRQTPLKMRWRRIGYGWARSYTRRQEDQLHYFSGRMEDLPKMDATLLLGSLQAFSFHYSFTFSYHSLPTQPIDVEDFAE
ncbi:hypothetical protein STAS_24885 [Striga asiatica]|uniref:Uncharacterized protein n=1 Tax=Striga asiatica TaxID=4170 RepID=A0A5A7QSB3_STRAF|nr:hypothetical protein STAS_24885 [Striga asiatica]